MTGTIFRLLIILCCITTFSSATCAAEQLRPTSAISALENLQRIMASPRIQNVVSTRSNLLNHHNFEAGATVADFFKANGLAVFFDMPETGRQTISQPLFFGTVGDLLDFLTEVLGYRVSMKGRGIYVVSSCWEDVYNLPAAPEVQRYITPVNLVAVMNHPKASVRYLPEVGKLYLYDDYRGHQRMADYVQGIVRRARMKTYLWHREQVQKQIQEKAREQARQVNRGKQSRRHWWQFWR